jgi:hypothetical protein
MPRAENGSPMGWRESFREDNALFFEIFGGYWKTRVYVFVVVCTFAHQAQYRWAACEGSVGCGLSFLKAAIWSLIWPFYWINYATDFVLLRPYG